jgi:hypothetical protein
MIIQTTEFGNIIVREAEKLLMSRCTEKSGRNDGTCVANIVKEYNLLAPVNKSVGMPYCAMTVSVILDKAFSTLGFLNILRSPTAKGFVDEAQKLGIKVNKVPKPGAILVARSGTGSGFHAGLVWYVKDNGIIGTIEGNTTGYHLTEDGCLVKSPREGVVTKERSAASIPYFIHVQDWFSNREITYRELTHTGLAGLSDNNYCLTEIERDDSFDEDSSPASDEKKSMTPWLIAGVVAIAGYFWLKD